MILLYFALLSEAQYFIEKLKAKKVKSVPAIYTIGNILIVIGGIGKKNTKKTLLYIFDNFNIKKAINIGIAGSKTKQYKIGELFCITHDLKQILCENLVTINNNNSDTPLNIVDMEGAFFYDFCVDKLKLENIYIFKIISDYLDIKKLNKEFVKQLIIKNYYKIKPYLNTN